MSYHRSVRLKILKILILLIATIFFTKSIFEYFRIETLEVIGTDIRVTVDEDRLSKNLLFFPSEKMANEILAENPILESVFFSKKYPHTLVLNVITRKPVVRLVTGEQELLLSSNGYVMGPAIGTTDLPVFEFPHGNLTAGEHVDNDTITYALLLLAEAPEEIKITKMRKYETNTVIASVENTEVIFPQYKQADVSMATLQNLLAGFRIKGIVPARVDLRFDKIIIQ